MHRLYVLTTALMLTGCHILFPFDTTVPPTDLGLEESTPVDGPGVERQPDLALSPDLLATDAPPADAPPADAPPADAPLADAPPADTPPADAPPADAQPVDAQPVDGPSSADVSLPLSWSTMSSGTNISLYDVWGHSSISVFAVGSTGTVLHYNGLGSSWKQLNVATTEQLWGVCGTHVPGQVLAVGNNGTLVRCNAVSCTKLSISYPGTPPPLTGCSCVTSASCYISSIQPGAQLGGLYELQNGNTMVQRYGGAGTGQLFGVWVWPSPLRVYAVGNGGSIIRFAGSYVETKPFSAHLKELWGVAADDIYAVGAAAMIPGYPKESTLLHRTAGAWSKISPTKSTAPLYGVWASGPANLYAVGGLGTILHFNGAQVTAIPATTTGANTKTLWAIWGTSANDIFVTGSNGLILRYH